MLNIESERNAINKRINKLLYNLLALASAKD